MLGKDMWCVLLRDTYQNVCPFPWITVSFSAQCFFEALHVGVPVQSSILFLPAKNVFNSS